MSAAPKNRQPWPMKWIVVAILLVAVPYTILTLRYRKPGPAFRPYEDMKNRANVVRLLDAGYQRVSLPAERPASGNPAPGGAIIAETAGGLPSGLSSTLVETPPLLSSIQSVSAASTALASTPYTIAFTGTLPSDQQQLVASDLYIRGGELVLIPTLERVGGDLLNRTRMTAAIVSIPASSLKPGHYTVTLVAEESSATWTMELQE